MTVDAIVPGNDSRIKSCTAVVNGHIYRESFPSVHMPCEKLSIIQRLPTRPTWRRLSSYRLLSMFVGLIKQCTLDWYLFEIHGWPDLSMGWRNQIPMLMKMGYRVVCPDMMGYGGTVIKLSFIARLVIADATTIGRTFCFQLTVSLQLEKCCIWHQGVGKSTWFFEHHSWWSRLVWRNFLDLESALLYWLFQGELLSPTG